VSDNHDNLVGWVIAGGGGTLIGSIIMTVIQTLGGRGRERADAADKTVSAADRIMDRLQTENLRMREAIVLLTEVLDDVIDDLDVPAAAKVKLRAANRQAKLAAI
jgi:hypothetical protein